MRLIAMGEACLIEGFDLLGFETYPDADSRQVEKLLCELIGRKDKALVFLEQALADESGGCYQRIRNESGHVVLVEMPPLHAPDEYRPPVEELVRRVLGPGALDGYS